MLTHFSTVTDSSADLLTISVAVLTGGLGVLVAASILADRGGLLPRTAVAFGRWVGLVAAGLSFGAASIHFAVIGEHFAEYPPYGLAFVALAWFQVGSAVAYLLAPVRRVAMAAIAGNVGALAIWAASRIVGLPIGPEPGQVEPIGSLDLTAAALELALIALLVWDLGAIARQWRPALRGASVVMVLGSSAFAVVLLTTMAFVVAGGDADVQAEHEVGPATTVAPSTAARPGQAPAASPSAGAVIDEGRPSPPASAGVGSSAGVSSPSAPAVAAVSPSRRPEATPRPATSAPSTAPSTPRPTPATTRPAAAVGNAGEIRFGGALDQVGEIASPTNRFREGQAAVWIAYFQDAPRASTIRLLIVQVLPDGREFEHWREDIAIVDPSASRLVGGAVLSLYVHGGEGSYRMRYLRGENLLAEGAFEFVP